MQRLRGRDPHVGRAIDPDRAIPEAHHPQARCRGVIDTNELERRAFVLGWKPAGQRAVTVVGIKDFVIHLRNSRAERRRKTPVADATS